MCTILYNPNFIKGAGTADGEACERAWSSLGKLHSMTKEMGVDKRHNVIEDALRYMWRLKLYDAPKLVKELKKCEKQLLLYDEQNYVEEGNGY
jgi:hypothetical protein